MNEKHYNDFRYCIGVSIRILGRVQKVIGMDAGSDADALNRADIVCRSVRRA